MEELSFPFSVSQETVLQVFVHLSEALAAVRRLELFREVGRGNGLDECPELVCLDDRKLVEGFAGLLFAAGAGHGQEDEASCQDFCE